MKIGDEIKVHLPGEWSWAAVVAIHAPHIVQARLLNEPASDLHRYRAGQVLTFQWRDKPTAVGLPAWEVSPPGEQLPFGPRLVAPEPYAPPHAAD